EGGKHIIFALVLVDFGRPVVAHAPVPCGRFKGQEGTAEMYQIGADVKIKVGLDVGGAVGHFAVGTVQEVQSPVGIGKDEGVADMDLVQSQVAHGVDAGTKVKII